MYTGRNYAPNNYYYNYNRNQQENVQKPISVSWNLDVHAKSKTSILKKPLQALKNIRKIRAEDADMMPYNPYMNVNNSTNETEKLHILKNGKVLKQTFIIFYL
jgi:hypothetical protein